MAKNRHRRDTRTRCTAFWPAEQTVISCLAHCPFLEICVRAASLVCHQIAQLGPLPADDDLQRIVFAEGLWTGAAALVMLTAVMARTLSGRTRVTQKSKVIGKGIFGSFLNLFGWLMKSRAARLLSGN